MKRIISMLTVVALLVALSAVPVFAVSPSQQECEAAGGTFTRTGGEVQCVIVTEEEGKNKKFTEETTTTETSQGTLQNEPQGEETTTTECEGTGSGKCPPGQFK